MKKFMTTKIWVKIIGVLLVVEVAWSLYTDRMDPAPQWTHYVTWAILGVFIACLVVFFVLWNKEGKDHQNDRRV